MIEFISTILQVIALITVIIGIAAYTYKTWGSEGDKIDESTIQRLNNAITALEKENERLRDEGRVKDDRLAAQDKQIAQLQLDVNRLKDLATGASAVANLKDMLHQFEFIIPMMQQFQDANSITHKGIAELREMHREERKITQRLERQFIEHFGASKIAITE